MDEHRHWPTAPIRWHVRDQSAACRECGRLIYFTEGEPMRRTNIRGHALRGEGKAHLPGDEEPWRYVGGYLGYGVCECGANSGDLESDAARKRWHADHKAAVRES